MLYGVGTGRCGTKSLAKQMGGLHEPEPSIHHEAIDYYRTGNISANLIRVIKQRAVMDVPIIVDNKQSLVIDIICRFDKDAEFIWLIRDIKGCVESFMKRGTYNQFRETHRISPTEGFPTEWDDKVKTHWMYFEKNVTILNALKRNMKLPKIILTSELTEKENVS